MRYLVKIHHSKGDYSAEVPDLPGCIAAAKTVERVRKLIGSAIAMHIESMQQSGEKVPRPRQTARLASDELEDVAFCTWVDVDLGRPVAQ